MKIQHKIVIPFTLLFIITTLLTALISINLMARILEARVATQLDQASHVITRNDFALNATILKNLKSVLGADVVTFRKGDGSVLASTLEPGAVPDLLSAVVTYPLEGNEFVLRDVTIGNEPFKIGYRPLSTPPNTWTAVIADTADIADMQRSIANGVLLAAVLLVLLMSVVGQLVARSVTAPVLRLVEFTKRVAAGERHQQSRIASNDEIGELGSAFDEMVGQLRSSEEKLLRSEKLAVTGLLAARVAHEVRNPLSAIKMQTQLLRSKVGANADTQALVTSILQGIDRVEWVVRGMLDLASEQALQFEWQSVNGVLDYVLEMTGPHLRHHKVEVRKDYSAGIPEMMLDRNRFILACLNLVMNSSDAMPNGGTLDVQTRKDGDAVIIEIVDDGVGIDPAVKDRLFDPFVTTKREGVGLGLVNTRSIIERHKGTIELSPGSGRGTRAIIRLPITKIHG